MATKAETEFDKVNMEAMRLLEDAYANALAAQLAGKDESEEWAKFQVILERAMVLAVLFGAADVVSIARSGGAKVEIDNKLEKFARHHYQIRKLIVAPFKDAIEAFLSRIPQLRSFVDKMTPALRAQSFWVTGVESESALARIQAQLGKQLQEVKAKSGFGLRPFIEFFRDSGFAKLTAARLETVYRTNTLSAFNAGRFEGMSRPGFKNQTALWRLTEVRDRRTRGNPAGIYPFPKFGPHFQMDGFMASTDDPIWRTIWPPNGYNCRGKVSPITWRTAERMGLAMEGQLILTALEERTAAQRQFVAQGLYPDQGFPGGPGVRAA